MTYKRRLRKSKPIGTILAQGCYGSYSNCFYIGLCLSYDICIYLRILVPNRISISDDDPVILTVAVWMANSGTKTLYFSETSPVCDKISVAQSIVV